MRNTRTASTWSMPLVSYELFTGRSTLPQGDSSQLGSRLKRNPFRRLRRKLGETWVTPSTRTVASLTGASHPDQSALRIFEMAYNEAVGRCCGTHDSNTS